MQSFRGLFISQEAFWKTDRTKYEFDGTKSKNSSYEKYQPRDQWFYLIKTPHDYIEIYDISRSWLMITIYLPNKIITDIILDHANF